MKHEIAADLLPLYHDGVCSAESKAAVEEHLQSCKICRDALAAMDTPLSSEQTASNCQEADGIRSLARKLEKSRHRALFIGLLIGLLLCLIVFGSLWLAGDVLSYPVPAEDFSYTIYQVPDEDAVLIHWEYKTNRESFMIFTFRDDADGRHYFVERPLLKKSFFKNQEVAQEHTIAITFEKNESPCYFDAGDKSVLLWKNGVPANFPTAPQKIVEKFGSSIHRPHDIQADLTSRKG